MRYPAGMPNRYGQPVRDRRPAVLVRADDPENQAAYTIACEARGLREGHRARALGDGSLLVKASSGDGSYRVRVAGVRDGLLVLRCSCPSGDYRARLPVPCKHAALAARRLEREGLARWEDGTWRLREGAQVRGARLLLARTVQRRLTSVPGMADAA
jgi:SWIM zinc finger